MGQFPFHTLLHGERLKVPYQSHWVVLQRPCSYFLLALNLKAYAEQPKQWPQHEA